MAVNKRTRYEVLRRDNHACRYCGGHAPDVSLTVDHVVPVSLGGSDDPANLVAACPDCNAGKAASSPDAALVEDVAADALRWARAMEAAEAMAASQYRAIDKRCDIFLEYWRTWTYTVHGEKQIFDLPADWRTKVGELLRGPGLLPRDIEDAIDTAMSYKYVKDEFAYCLSIMRNKLIARQIIARELMDEGRV